MSGQRGQKRLVREILVISTIDNKRPKSGGYKREERMVYKSMSSPKSRKQQRERAIFKEWRGVKDGVSLGRGIPKEDLYIHSSHRFPFYLASRVVLMKHTIDTQRTFATGYLVDVNCQGTVIPCVLTCWHAVWTRFGVQNMDIFSFVSRPRRLIWKTDAAKFLVKVPNIDLCLLALDGRAIRRNPLSTHTALCPNSRIAITIPQHPNGSVLAIDTGEVVRDQKHTLLHNASTLPGSSGAPIFVHGTDGSWKLVGVHSLGNTDGWNEGVCIAPILNELRRQNCVLL